MKSYGAEIHGHILCNDDMEKITAAIMKLKEEGADLIVCTGGMSVDPDDKTPGAIKNTGARIVSYGAPVLPRAMFLLSYLEDGTPVMGLPGCVMYAKPPYLILFCHVLSQGIEVTKKIWHIWEMADSVLVAKNVIIRTAALERAYKSRTGGISMEKLTVE